MGTQPTLRRFTYSLFRTASLDRGTLPACEGFDSKELGKPEAVVAVGGSTVSVFSSLPEFARVASREQRFIFLAFVHENRIAFKRQIAWAKRHGDFDFMKWIFLPSTSVHEDFGKGATFGLPSEQDCKNSFGADAVSSVRIGKVSGDIDLVGSNTL